MRSRLAASVRLAAWTAALVVMARLLLAAGSDTLSVPVTSFDDLSVWVSETPPADMVIALLRLAALAAIVYLLAATVLAVAARLISVRTLVAAADVLTPAVVRRLATGGSGIGLVVGGAIAGLPAHDLPFGAGGEPVALTAAPAGPDTPSGTATATMARVPAAEATMTRVDPSTPPSATMTRVPDPAAVPPVAATPVVHAPTASSVPGPAALEVDPTVWVVEPGDSLWSIAEEVTESTDGTPAAERTVTRYWQRLVAANRDNLVDPDNPDLIVPGQQLVLPAFVA